MKTADFRKDLLKIMPGYNWTVHNSSDPESGFFSAEGIKTAGFNRLSTVHVYRREKAGVAEYEVKSSGFGKRAPWLSSYSAGTLAQAFRGLQNHYENVGRNYLAHGRDLESARKVAGA